MKKTANNQVTNGGLAVEVNGVHTLTVKARSEYAYRKLSLIIAACRGADGMGVLECDEIAGIQEAATEALNELYWVTISDGAEAAAPTGDERRAMEAADAA